MLSIKKKRAKELSKATPKAKRKSATVEVDAFLIQFARKKAKEKQKIENEAT